MIVIVDYEGGNVASVRNMIRRAGADAIISGRPQDVERCSKLVLPGVGAFDYGMGNLSRLGLIDPIREVADKGKPVLGICLGMQLLGRGSDEGHLTGLGLIDSHFHRFREEQVEPGKTLRVPHVGWNSVEVCRENPLLPMDAGELRFYFVHSFYAECAHSEDVIATTRYGRQFPSVYGSGNIYGCQFHPEKSHRFGLALVQGFLDI